MSTSSLEYRWGRSILCLTSGFGVISDSARSVDLTGAGRRCWCAGGRPRIPARAGAGADSGAGAGVASGLLLGGSNVGLLRNFGSVCFPFLGFSISCASSASLLWCRGRRWRTLSLSRRASSSAAAAAGDWRRRRRLRGSGSACQGSSSGDSEDWRVARRWTVDLAVAGCGD